MPIRAVAFDIGGVLERAQPYEVFTERWRRNLGLGQLGVPPGQVIFIDDKQANVDAAGRLGMRGLLHTDTEESIRAIESLLAG
jgi:hypothetical protein